MSNNLMLLEISCVVMCHQLSCVSANSVYEQAQALLRSNNKKAAAKYAFFTSANWIFMTNGNIFKVCPDNFSRMSFTLSAIMRTKLLQLSCFMLLFKFCRFS